MPRLEELVTLCTVVEQKSFSRAAGTLNLTQPAVSMQIKSLEDEYGTKLLHRDGFEVVPTESGRSVYEFACKIIDLYERSRQAVGELDASASGKLVVGASTGAGEYILPLLLGQFKNLYPQVEITLRVGDSGGVIEDILRHRLELGFVGFQRRDRHLQFEPFIKDELVLVVSPDHPWASQPQVSYEELLRVPLVLQQHGSGATEALAQALGQHNIDLGQLNVAMQVGLQESTKAAVRAGYGATIISRLGAIEELRRGVLIQVPVEGLYMEREFFVAYRRTSPLTNLAQTFVEFARQEVSTVIHSDPFESDR